MLSHRLQLCLTVIIGALVVGVINFLIFIHFYKAIVIEHLTEYWRTVHGGLMLTEVLPAYLLVGLVSVVMVVLVTYKIVGTVGLVKPASHGEKG